MAFVGISVQYLRTFKGWARYTFLFICCFVILFCITSRSRPYVPGGIYSFTLTKIAKLQKLARPNNATFEILPTQKQHKLIFLGNAWSGFKFDRQQMEKTLKDEKCPAICSFSMDQSDLSLADAVIFETWISFERAFYISHLPNQRFIYRDVESPIYSNAFDHVERDEAFNWTMTYHRSSDIMTYYGYFEPLQFSQRPYNAHLITSNMTTYSLYMEALEKYDNSTEVPSYIGANTKTNIVAWMSSHCPTSSLRESYVEELSKYMQVYTYGKCGDEPCGDRWVYGGPCWETTIGPNFYFYLSMENSLCEDYVTEKLFNPMLYGIVPIVYGGANYSRFLPPNSYIDARQFYPKDLAYHLKNILEDPVAYQKFHLWRKFWKVKLEHSYCNLCMKLHQDFPPKMYHDIEEFRRSREPCLTPDSWNDVINI